MPGKLLAVCVVAEIHPLSRKSVVDSAIDKRAVNGSVQIGADALAGDYSCDTKFHGGGDQAVYAYSLAEQARWADELGREIPPGWFGENLLVDGLDVTDAVIGSRWEVGTAVLEVTMHREPCATFAKWVGEPRWVKRFTERADVGAYLRVVVAGAVEAGDAITVTHVPEHGVTVRDLFRGNDIDALRRLVAQPGLAAKVYSHAGAKSERAER